jgi:hypothetical protein
VKCSLRTCESTDIVLRADWKPARNCPDNGVPTVYCRNHAGGYRSDREKPFRCTTCPSGHKCWMRRLTELDPYEAARLHYLESGLIADKEAMLEQVAYNVPAGWDTFGSLLAWPPPDQHVKWLDRPPSMALKTAASVFVMALVLGVMWLTGAISIHL